MTPIADMVEAFAVWLRSSRRAPLEPREVREFVYCAIHRRIVPLADATLDEFGLYVCSRCAGQVPR